MRILKTCQLLLFLVMMYGCTYDNREEMAKKNVPCTPSNVSFSKDVFPIIQSNCLSCHIKGVAEGGVLLDEYSMVKKYASNGVLVGVITHSPGFPPMPQNGGKLSDCDIEKIKVWINEGINNN